MHISTILRISGLLLMMFSLCMLPPVVVDQIYQEYFTVYFIKSFMVTFISGATIWGIFYRSRQELRVRDGFIIVVLFWTSTCAFAALPFWLAEIPGTGITDALFEAVSGFTTTGASILTHIDALPRSMMFYRQWLQFLGGMGIVVLAVAILPFLGVGGLQLFRAEMPGPTKENKLTPRITETAKMLWMIYVGLTFLCMLSYWLLGLSVFDAIGASFSTVSTGGFFMYGQSLGYFQNPMVHVVAMIFIILGATNFTLHFYALRTKNMKCYWQDEEFRFFIGIMVFLIAFSTMSLMVYNGESNFWLTLKSSAFTVVSLMTTTGLSIDNFSAWPAFLPVMIMIIAIIGGCAGSTTGGLKMLRVLLLHKQAKRELHRLLHPQAVMTIRYGKTVFPYYVLQAIWAFIGAFILLFLIFWVLLMATGLDAVTAFSAVVISLANAGAGIGGIAQNCADVSEPGKWVLIVAMLTGRLEIFTVLVLLTPEFWRR